MKLLLDTNVLLDSVLRRQPWAGDAIRLIAEVERGRAAGYLAGHTVTTAHYIIEKVLGRQGARASVSEILRLFEIVPVEKADFHHAAALGLRDYEDAVQAVCALKVDVDFIVTRNEKDFQGLPIPACAPGAVLALL